MAATLDDLGPGGEWDIHGRRLRVTNLDEVLFPGRPGQEPVTKREFLRYTAAIAPTLVPYPAGWAVNLHRYPDGVTAPGFWHKDPSYALIDLDPGTSTPWEDSPRPAAGAPVSAPIDWDELDDPDLRPDGFTIRTILPRLAERGDLFRAVLDQPQYLPRSPEPVASTRCGCC